jgi:hypothetical protein
MQRNLEIGSILNLHDRCRAVDILSEKAGIFVTNFLTLYGLFADATQRSSVEFLWKAKDKPEGTALDTLLPPKLLTQIADFGKISKPFRTILKKPALTMRYYRIPYFLQIPVKENSILPEVLITPGDENDKPATIINMWFPGYRPIDSLLNLAFERGIIVPCTSLNYRHHPSVTDKRITEEFCDQSLEVNFMLTDYSTRLRRMESRR